MRRDVSCLMPVLTIVMLMAVSCASIIHGSKQSVTFQTNPAGATVEVFDGMGVSYGVCDTPCSLDLKRKREYKIKISKPGYASAEMVIQKKSDGWIWGNILFGGVIGLIVDFTTGAAYKLDPSALHVTLSEESIGNLTLPEDGAGILLFDIDDLSAEERAKLADLTPIAWPFQ